MSVVVVTGASAAVRRAPVRTYVRHGASITVIARGRDGLAAANDVQADGGHAVGASPGGGKAATR